MSRRRLVKKFQDKRYRHGYVESFLDTSIATQIRVLRQQRGWTQKELAERIGSGQSRISAMEDVNYSNWSINTLKKLARAFDLALVVRFESYGEALPLIENFSRGDLEKQPFQLDDEFREEGVTRGSSREGGREEAAR